MVFIKHGVLIGVAMGTWCCFHLGNEFFAFF